MQEWKMWQEMYNNLVTDHSDAGHKHLREIRDLTVENALFYILEQAGYGIYPAKSYMVAIIYATKLQEVYGEDFYEVLDDPELLYGQDDFFVPYSQNKAFYDELIEALKTIPNWIEKGWAPKTVEYFHLECTEAGVASIS
ncbi:hypothetical protein AVU38_gp081 [Ralstonia phage RSL2]|uniref:Uncharacterized protein n=1 Tax=Ralstonia phage RSL2 TaxID=1585840 RepID=A0A0A8J9D9_9CAUD|nr:hypothetical protein AVU38_gp081 [Ralstonia phage RSL2]BAQ02609.1 hypothetical protein [Ralstonia phage RSL2]